MSEYRPMPGNLVRARGRDWVVQAGSSEKVLVLRPLRGGDELVYLAPELEREAVRPAFFDDPTPTQLTNIRSASLFRNALLLKLRSGAGPFRSFGKIAVEPRTYQLVPLLMALKMDPVRLLICDDVGIGKTIEACLIVRELWDRFEIDRFAVLCPPHLVEQWVGELQDHFNFPAVALTSSSVASLEKNLPMGQSLFDRYPVLVVSLDYIKNPKHRDYFLSTAPNCIIVDEAHTCTSKGKTQQLRYELLKRLSQDKKRSLIMLTATPHSGDDEAFHNLLGLLDEKYETLGANPDQDKKLRDALGDQLVQRRRIDIMEWDDDSIFPTRNVAEVSYRLDEQWRTFFEDVRIYCATLAQTYEDAQSRVGKMIWYSILALFRCVSSSPSSAVSALTTRLKNINDEPVSMELEDILDDEAVDFAISDATPTELFAETHDLKRLLKQAKKLEQEYDPKIDALTIHLKKRIIKDGFRPVVFCKYIATAKYVGEKLKEAFPRHQIDVITGELSPEERQQRIIELGEHQEIILVATDCLSEGINLQERFNAVVHYDLAWNPTRHEQREGRVDRFGQKSPEVRCTMLYCEDNPIDGFIFNVILRKADAIKKDLGILVPIPENNEAISNALVQASLLKQSFRGTDDQLTFDFGEMKEVTDVFETPWRDAQEKAKANRTIFAQRSLHPEEVVPEWREEQQLLGSSETIWQMISTLLSRLGGKPKKTAEHAYEIDPSVLPSELRGRLGEASYDKPFQFSLKNPAPEGAQFIHRSHPVVDILSDYIVEDTLDEHNDRPIGGRAAVIETTEVEQVYLLFMIRLRHQIATRIEETTRHLMAEEVVVIGARGMTAPEWIEEGEALALLSCEPSRTLPKNIQEETMGRALEFYRSQQETIEGIGRERAKRLLEHNRRVRSAADARGSVSVDPCFPADLMGVYVLLPSVDAL
jgi:superfamily II DNA or RNA helicase